MRRFAVLSLLAACAAPPMGLGAGPLSPSPGRTVVEGRTGMAAASGQQTFQVEASAVGRFVRAFGMEVGVAVTRTALRGDDGTTLTSTGGFPFVRPRLQLGPVNVAVAAAGLGMGGGGGGIIGGIADVQVGYATAAWSAYVGAYAHGFELVGEPTSDVSSRQARVGGRYEIPAGRFRIGVGVELYAQRGTMRQGGAVAEIPGFGAGLKLAVTSPEFR